MIDHINQINRERWNALARANEDMTQRFPHWDVKQPDGSSVRLDSPHEFATS